MTSRPTTVALAAALLATALPLAGCGGGDKKPKAGKHDKPGGKGSEGPHG